MMPTRAAVNTADQIGVFQGGPAAPLAAAPNLPAPDPSLGAAMRNRDWAGREQASYYEMRHAPQPWQYTRDQPHALYGGGSGTPMTQWLPPQGPPTGFAARQAPVVYSAPGVQPRMTRPTYAYNRVIGDPNRRPTMYVGTWPAQSYPQGSNTFVPSWEATGMVVRFTREASRFRLVRYVKSMSVPKSMGYYLTLSGDDPYRVVSINDYLWEDSADAPGGRQERQGFGFQPYRTARYCFPFSLGSQSVEQAEWPILAEHAAMMAAKAMTVRTMLSTTLLTTSAYWSGTWGTNFGNAAGAWTTSSETDLFIQTTLNTALIAVEQASGGIVTDEEALQLTFNPTLARGVSKAPEYRNYIKGSPDALAAITDQRNPNRKYGLAPFLYGLRLVVENAIQVTSPKPANVTTQPTASRSYIWPATQAVISSKPTGISATDEQSLDFSTVQFRFLEEMTTEQKSDSDNRRQIGRVVENYTVSLVAPQTGYLINSIS